MTCSFRVYFAEKKGRQPHMRSPFAKGAQCGFIQSIINTQSGQDDAHSALISPY
jgi:hypothetical protein